MYYLDGIEKLSPTQAHKLMKGHPVRVKKGMSHKMHLRPDQIKKLQSSHMKGKGTTLVLDPYQIDLNRETLGGAMSLKKIGRVIKHGFDKYVKPEIKPLMHKALNTGVKALSAYSPEFAPIASQVHQIGTHAIDTAGQKYGFGIKKSKGPGRPKMHHLKPPSHRRPGRPRKHGGALFPPM